MNIQLSTVSGRIIRACRENNPTLAGFGETEEEAIAKLVEREQARDLEIRALGILIRSLLAPGRSEWVVN